MDKKVDPIWAKLMRECKQRGLGYAELGRLCDVTRPTVYGWFKVATPTISTVRKVAAVLGYKIVLVEK